MLLGALVNLGRLDVVDLEHAPAAVDLGDGQAVAELGDVVDARELAPVLAFLAGLAARLPRARPGGAGRAPTSRPASSLPCSHPSQASPLDVILGAAVNLGRRDVVDLEHAPAAVDLGDGQAVAELGDVVDARELAPALAPFAGLAGFLDLILGAAVNLRGLEVDGCELADRGGATCERASTACFQGDSA